MAKIYASLIILGHKTIEEVPQKLRFQVETLLEEYYKLHSNT